MEKRLINNLLAMTAVVMVSVFICGCYALTGNPDSSLFDDKKYEEEDIGGISSNTDTTISWGDICPKVGEPCDKGDVCDHNFTSNKHQCRPIHTAHEGESCTGTVGKLGSHTSLTNQYLCVEGLVCDDKNGWPETCRVPDPCEFCTPEQACVELVCKDDIMSPLEHELFEMVQKYELAGDTVWLSESGLATATLDYKKVKGRWQYRFEVDGQATLVGELSFPVSTGGKYECTPKLDNNKLECVFTVGEAVWGFGYELEIDFTYIVNDEDGIIDTDYFKRQPPSK